MDVDETETKVKNEEPEFGDGATSQQGDDQDDTPEQQQQQNAEEPSGPPPAQAGAWSAYQDDSGQTYYYNNDTGQTQWEEPEGFNDAAAAGADAGGADVHSDDGAGGISPVRDGTPPSSPIPYQDDGAKSDESVSYQKEDIQGEPEPEPEPEIDSEQKRLEDAENALNQSDAIMEPGESIHS